MSLTWFITGTSSGLGRIMTERLLERGDRVAATLRKVHLLDDLKAKYGDRLSVAALDVRDTPAVRKVVDSAFSALQRIDVIVNNAAYGLFGAAEEVSDDQIRDQIDTNLIGSIQIIRASLPHLRSQGAAVLFRFHRKADRSLIPISVCITRLNGESRASSRR
ncbi:MAG: SDR family NAD(P)-dependent oxidoreductase [Terracidiphilus sp.]|jgi:NAD(P)-dependent dehydrogenase (short-subunit alcohol dehydrogenase family)